MTFSLEDLNGRIADRSLALPEESYTAKLISEGIDRCARKFGEEAIEAVIAAATRDRRGLVSETADVLYHLLVLLKATEIPLDEVMQQLERRTNQSGLAEKAARKTPR